MNDQSASEDTILSQLSCPGLDDSCSCSECQAKVSLAMNDQMESEDVNLLQVLCSLDDSCSCPKC